MELNYFGYDADLQAIKRCDKHREICSFYRRNPEAALCHKCKQELDNSKDVKITNYSIKP